MSAWLMSKLDIDVLVTLGLYGPAEATGEWRRLGHDRWFPLTGSPEAAAAAGATLWRVYAEHVLDPEYDEPLPEYAFERALAWLR